MTRPAGAIGLGMLAAVTLGALPGAAQDFGAYRTVATAPTPLGRVAALAIRLPVGSGEDQAGSQGGALLLARTLAAQANDALSPGFGRVQTLVDRQSTTFVLLVSPAAWRTAWEVVDRTVFDVPLDESVFERERSALRTATVFQAGSPRLEFDLEATRLLVPPDDPWARPTGGTPSSLEALSLSDLESIRAVRFARGAAALALAGRVPGSPEPARSAGRAQAAGLAWESADRVVLTREVTSTWIAVAYAADPAIPRTSLEFVAHLVGEALDPVPSDPTRYSASADIEETPAGPALVIRAAVVPEAADRWEGELLRTVQDLAQNPPRGAFFRWARRRFRARALMRESRPEIEVVRMSADLLRNGESRAMRSEISALTEEMLGAAVAGLHNARVLRLGPDLGQRGGLRPEA